MATDTSDIRSTLNDLIETLKDGEEGFRSSSEKVTNPEIRAELLNLANQRASFARELQSEVTAIGGEPASSGSTSGAIHRGWIGLKAALTGNDDHAILAEAERGEDSAVKNYRDALSKDLPSDIREVIDRQFRQVAIAHNQVRALRDGTRVEKASDAAPRTY
jgi:uncharacterized protein (TIGR02284 family)